MKQQVIVEKETIIKEVRGERKEKITLRVIIQTEGKERSIVFTPQTFKAFQKEIAKITL